MPVFGRDKRKTNARYVNTQIVRSGKRKFFLPREKWGKESTPLKEIEMHFGYSISNFIPKCFARKNALKGPKSPVIVLDWGCGTGKALNDLHKMFGEKVKLYGFSKDSFPEWVGSKHTAFIQEETNVSPRFFKKGSIDLIYSSLGLGYLLG
ncbi:MAG: hypothetical protein AABW85_04575, partial [archaeon]